MEYQLTELKNQGGGLEFQFSKFVFQTSSKYKKCHSSGFRKGIFIISNINKYDHFFIDYLIEIMHK